MDAKFIACVILISSLFGAAAVTAQEAAPSVERGQRTFMRVGCHLCHGTHGQGSGAGGALTPNTLPTEAIVRFIRATPGRMPAYPQEVLSDSEVADIVAFLKSIPPPPSAESIGILKYLKPGM